MSKFIFNLITTILILFFITVLFVRYSKGEDDYSSDFEYEMQKYDNDISKDYKIDSSALIKVIKRQREDKLIKQIYIREKYTYRPLSPNKKQHREMTKTHD